MYEVDVYDSTNHIITRITTTSLETAREQARDASACFDRAEMAEIQMN